MLVVGLAVRLLTSCWCHRQTQPLGPRGTSQCRDEDTDIPQPPDWCKSWKIFLKSAGLEPNIGLWTKIVLITWPCRSVSWLWLHPMSPAEDKRVIVFGRRDTKLTAWFSTCWQTDPVHNLGRRGAEGGWRSHREREAVGGRSRAAPGDVGTAGCAWWVAQVHGPARCSGGGHLSD